jgi:hypothetical protein
MVSSSTPLSPKASSSLLLIGERQPFFVAYLLLVVSLPLARPALFLVGGQPVLLTDVFLLAVYALGAREWLRGRLQFRFDAYAAAALLYVGALVVSGLAGGTLFTKQGVKLAAYALLVFLPSLIQQCVDSESRALLVVRAWLWGLVVVLAVGFVGIIAFYLDRDGLAQTLMCGYGGAPSGNYPRLCSPFRTPNMFANYLGAALPLLVAFGRPNFGRGPRLLLLALSGIVVTFTISAAIGGFALAFAGTWWVMRLRGGRGWNVAALAVWFAAVAVALVMALVSIGIFVPAGQGHLPLGSKDLLLMEGQRPGIWRGVAPALEEHPWLGIGYGIPPSVTTDPRTFTSADKIARGEYPAVVPPHRLEAHNVVLSVAGQAGVIGLVAFLFVVYRLVQRFRRGSLSAELSMVRVAAGIGLLASVGYSGLFASIEEARHIWALAGLLLIASKPEPGVPADSQSV